jgi:hypothetical protein
VDRRVRESILNQGVVKPETPRERRMREQLAEDLEGSPVAGRPLRTRLRNFTPQADAYLAALGGPLPYMTRLREIHRATAEHEEQLREAWLELAAECDGDAEEFAARWRDTVEGWRFDEVNDLIARHNRWYPAEAKLAMDPKTGDYVLVAGKPYRLPPLGARWALERFPATPPALRAA